MEYFENKEFDKIENSIIKYDNEREDLIQKSREIIKQSKVVINGIHRKEDVKKEITKLDKQKKNLDMLLSKNTKLYNEGMAKVAFQEYAEAKLFSNFFNKEKLSVNSLDIDEEHYLLGLCDLTGELARMSVMSATQKQFNVVKEIQTCIQEIYEFFIKLNLRNSELRKKSDQIKWNLKKVEEILYDISIHKQKD